MTQRPVMLAVEHQHLDVLPGQVAGQRLRQRGLGLLDEPPDTAERPVEVALSTTALPTGSAIRARRRVATPARA